MKQQQTGSVKRHSTLSVLCLSNFARPGKVPVGARVYGVGARVYGAGARVYGVRARVYGSLVIIESAPVQRIWFLVFQTWSGLWGPDLGTIGTGDWDLNLGLTILHSSADFPGLSHI